MKDVFRVNNFDIIRLLAALQVALLHSLSHLEIKHHVSTLIEIVNMFPGVPIFFFISGFLISKSYENNSEVNEYFQNRILRIYPALIVCTIVALSSVILTGYLSNITTNAYLMTSWIVGQLTFIQFFNPDFMRGFGTGVLNGSLWTITVELQFYILILVLYRVFGMTKKIAGDGARQINVILAFSIFLFIAVNIIYYKLKGGHSENFLLKLWGVSFSPWFYMFLVGVLFQKNFDQFYCMLRGRFLFILGIYMVISYFVKSHLGWSIGGNTINPLSYFLLAASIFSFAYSLPTLSHRILAKNDISYGVYLYHIPIINLFIYYGCMYNTFFLLLVLVLTVILGYFSWVFIEKPAIKLKKHPLNPLQMGLLGAGLGAPAIPRK